MPFGYSFVLLVDYTKTVCFFFANPRKRKWQVKKCLQCYPEFIESTYILLLSNFSSECFPFFAFLNVYTFLLFLFCSNRNFCLIPFVFVSRHSLSSFSFLLVFLVAVSSLSSLLILCFTFLVLWFIRGNTRLIFPIDLLLNHVHYSYLSLRIQLP